MIGIDEVGRGAWAGPLLVCAVRLNNNVVGLADSKTLSAKKRETLSNVILLNGEIGYGWVPASELDAIGLSKALRLATARALTEISPKENEAIIIDGTINFAAQYKNVQTLVRADQTVPAVSAASIVAKVARDKYMRELAEVYPDYGFDKHVGYGTRIHAEAIRRCGFCIEHRRSFKLPQPELTKL